MKQLILIIIIIALNTTLTTACLPFFLKKPVDDSLLAKAKRLKDLYLLSSDHSSSNEVYQKQFFDEFPNTFEALNDLYGYINHTPAPLYFDATNQISNFFNNNSVNDTFFYQKIILIAIGGHWNADAVSIFQEGLHDRVLSKVDLTVFLLQKIPDDKIKSFWYFYFDGVFSVKKIPEQLQKIKSINLKIYNLMIEASKEIKSKE